MPRACDACYHRKVKCDSIEGETCGRCLANNLECHHDGRRQSKISRIDNQVNSLASELRRVRSQMDAMQRKLDSMPGAPVETRSSESKRHDPPSTSTLTDLSGKTVRHQSYGRETRTSQSSNNTMMKGSSSIPESAENDNIEDDPLVELATMAPLSKMVTDAETLPTATTHRHRSYHDSPLSNHSGSGIGSSCTTVDLVRLPGDPIEMGILSESRGRNLLEIYYRESHQSLPILDPRFDTWDSIRSRSALLLSTLLFVGLIVEGRGAPAVDEQHALRSHIMSLAAEKVLVASSPTMSSVEGIQALLILSGWGQAGWRFSGHAFRLGLEAQLHRCLPTLAYIDHHSPNLRPQDIEREQAKVVGARLWLAICKMEYEMAFNYCRPLLIGDDPSISLGRRFLQHPMSMVTDARLVSAVELLSGRTRSHLTFLGPIDMTEEKIFEEVVQDNGFLERWFKEWDVYYNLIGLQQGSYIRDILLTSKCHVILTTNSRLLHNLAVHHGGPLSAAQRHALPKAVHAAWTLLQMATSDRGYGAHFASSNTLTHIGVIFAVRLLLRFVTLAPTDIDLREVGCKVDQFVTVLQQIPGQLSVDRIRQTLLRARHARVLPPRSGRSTPLSSHTARLGTLEPLSGTSNDVQESSAMLSSTLGLAWCPEPGAELVIPPQNTNQWPSDGAYGLDDDLTDLWQIFGS